MDKELDDYFEFVLIEKDEVQEPTKTQSLKIEFKISKEQEVMAGG
jgi:hypothetical protein